MDILNLWVQHLQAMYAVVSWDLSNNQQNKHKKDVEHKRTHGTCGKSRFFLVSFVQSFSMSELYGAL